MDTLTKVSHDQDHHQADADNLASQQTDKRTSQRIRVLQEADGKSVWVSVSLLPPSATNQVNMIGCCLQLSPPHDVDADDDDYSKINDADVDDSMNKDDDDDEGSNDFSICRVWGSRPQLHQERSPAPIGRTNYYAYNPHHHDYEDHDDDDGESDDSNCSHQWHKSIIC